MAQNKKTKRALDDSSDEEHTIPKNISNSWFRFLVVFAADGTPLKLNPFAISKALYGIVGDVQDVKKLRSGLLLLVECKAQKQSSTLQAAKLLVSTAVLISPHKTLKSSKGIVRDRDRCLYDMTENEFADELQDQGVTHVSRTKEKNKSLNQTPI